MNDVASQRAPRSRVWLSLAALVLVFAGGALFWSWLSTTYFADAQTPAVSPADDGRSNVLSPSPSAIVLQPGSGAQPDGLASLDSRLRLLEQSRATEGGSSALPTGTERLVLILVARRAMERGAPHDQIARALAGSFGSQSSSLTEAVIANASNPAGLLNLTADFDKVAAELDRSAGESWFESLANLAVIRQKSADVKTPSELIAEARTALKAGDIASAAALIGQHPARGEAQDWLNRARRTAAESRALDNLEKLALSQPAAAPTPAPPPVVKVIPDALQALPPTQDNAPPANGALPQT